MSNPHGEAHTGLHTRPTIQDAGIAPHPAIATDQSPDVYDPQRAAGAKAAGGDAAKQRIFVSQGQETSRPKKTIRRYPARNAIAHAERMAQADERRRLAVADYEGGQRLGAVAMRYGVNPRTIIDWASRFRPADAPRRRPDLRKPPELVIDYESVHVVGINRGAGGSMSDQQVREATMRLRTAIVALQRRLGWRTFEYAMGAGA